MDHLRDAFASNGETYLSSDDGNVAADAAVGTFDLGTHCASFAVAHFHEDWVAIGTAGGGLGVACAIDAPAEEQGIETP